MIIRVYAKKYQAQQVDGNQCHSWLKTRQLLCWTLCYLLLPDEVEFTLKGLAQLIQMFVTLDAA